MRAALAGRYNTVRPFLTLLGESAALHAAPGGERVLAAVRALPELAGRRVTQKPLTGGEIDSELVTPAWKRAVYASTEQPAGAVDRDAYVVCVLEALHRALGRRDVCARPSHRWADPRALLLDGQRWEAVREDVLAGLSLTDPAPAHLARQLITLDAAWKQTAARLGKPATTRGPGSCPARMAAPGWSSTTLTRSTNPTAWSGCVRRRRR